MQKQQIRKTKKKDFLALSAATLFVMTTPVQAKQEICVFDLLEKAGESYKLVRGMKLAAKTWQGDVELILIRMKKKQKKILMRANVTNGVYMTSMRARKYNKFAGSVDAMAR